MWQERKGAVHTWHLYELKQHCKAEWDKIPPQCYELLIKSYRKPSLQVTAAKSGSVSYWIMGGISFLTALNRVVLKLSLMTHTWMNHYGKEEPTALIPDERPPCTFTHVHGKQKSGNSSKIPERTEQTSEDVVLVKSDIIYKERLRWRWVAKWLASSQQLWTGWRSLSRNHMTHLPVECVEVKQMNVGSYHTHIHPLSNTHYCMTCVGQMVK